MNKKSDEKFCHECGEIIKVKAEICPKCGVRQPDAQITLEPTTKGVLKKKSVAAILALFLGFFGFHHFYLGQPGIGLFYLLFCWTGITLVLGFIECLSFISMKEKDFQNKYPGPAWTKAV